MKKALRTKDEIERCLAVYVYPRWKDRRFLEIRRTEVNALLDHIEDKHGTAQADKVLAIVCTIFNWYQKRTEHYTNPVVRGMMRGGKTARDRTLSDPELRALWQAADDSGTFGAFCKVALLTGQRNSKVATMQHDHINGDGVWTIATEAREKGNAGELRLPAMALDIIRAQPRIAGNPFVFAGRGGRPIGNQSTVKAALDDKMPKDMPPWCVHDLRRTARSLLSRGGILPHISERVLGHTIRGVEGPYDRHSYAHEKADALERLATLIDRIVNPPSGNVMPMVKKA